MERFFQKIVGAGAGRFHGRAQIGVTGNHHHIAAWRRFFQPFQCFDAIDAAHLHVQEYHIRRKLLHGFQKHFPGFERLQFFHAIAQNNLKGTPDILLVVNDGDG